MAITLSVGDYVIPNQVYVQKTLVTSVNTKQKQQTLLVLQTLIGVSCRITLIGTLALPARAFIRVLPTDTNHPYYNGGIGKNIYFATQAELCAAFELSNSYIADKCFVKVLNTSGVAISKNDLVYQTGFDASMQLATIALASAAVEATSVVLGAAAEDIGIGAMGSVLTDGSFQADTSSFTINEQVYLSDTLGQISATSGTLLVTVGRVLSVSVTGSIAFAGNITSGGGVSGTDVVIKPSPVQSTFANPVTNAAIGTTEPGLPVPLATGRTSLAHGQGSYTAPFASSSIAWGRYCTTNYYSSFNLGINQYTDSGNTMIVGFGQNTNQSGYGGQHFMLGVFNYLDAPGQRINMHGYANTVNESTSAVLPPGAFSNGNHRIQGAFNTVSYGQQVEINGFSNTTHSVSTAQVLGSGNTLGSGTGQAVGIAPGNALSSGGNRGNMFRFGSSGQVFANQVLAGGFYGRFFGDNSLGWGSNVQNWGQSTINVGQENRTYGAYAVGLGIYNQVGSVGARRGGFLAQVSNTNPSAGGQYGMAGAREFSGGVGLGLANRVSGVQGFSQGAFGSAPRSWQRVWTSNRQPASDATLFPGTDSPFFSGGVLAIEGTHGAAQTSRLVLWDTTTDATPKNVAAVYLEEDKTYCFETKVLSRNRDDDGESHALSGSVLASRAATILTHGAVTSGPFTVGERIVGDTTQVLRISHLQTGTFTPTETVEGPQRVSIDPDTYGFELGPMFNNGNSQPFGSFEEDYYETDTLLDHSGVTGTFNFDYLAGTSPPGPTGTGSGNPEGVTQAVSGAKGYIRALGQYFSIGSVSGTFVSEETITGGTSGAQGILYRENGSTMWVVQTSKQLSLTGTFQNGETVTGSVNSATAVLGSAPTEFVAINRVTVATFVTSQTVTGDISGATLTTTSGSTGGVRGFAPNLGDDFVGFLKSTITGTFTTGEWLESDISQLEDFQDQIRPPRGTRVQLTSGQSDGDSATLASVDPLGTLSITGLVAGASGNEWFRGVTVEGQTSGAWVRIEDAPAPAHTVIRRDNGGTLDVRESFGLFQNGETVTGDTSGASTTLSLAPTVASAVLTGTASLATVAKEGSDATSAQYVASGTSISIEATGVAAETVNWLSDIKFPELLG
jgi:hypothetical protein